MSRLIKQFPTSNGSSSIRIELQRLLDPNDALDHDEKQDHEQTILHAKEKARRIIEAAEREAEELLSKTNRELNERTRTLDEKEQSIQQQAEAAMEEGKKIGFQEGYNAGKSEAEAAYQDKLTEAKNILSKAKSHYSEKVKEAEPDLIKLSVEVAGKIVGSALQMDEAYESYVTQALKQVKGEEDVKLFTSPERYEQVLLIVKKLQNVFNVDIMVYPDEAMANEQCLIETKYGQIDASVDSQLTQVKEKLLELAGEEDEHSTTTDSIG